MRTFLTVLGVGLIAYLFSSGTEAFTEVSPNVVDTKLYDAIIDVRTLKEYNNGHLKNAVLLEDLHQNNNRMNDLIRIAPYKNSKLLFYCKTGRRAKIASQVAESVGYKNIHTVTNGGYVDLKK